MQDGIRLHGDGIGYQQGIILWVYDACSRKHPECPFPPRVPRYAIFYKAKPTTTAPTPINPAIPAGSKVLAPEVDEADEAGADDAPEAAEETFDAPVAATGEAEEVPEEDAMLEPEVVAAAAAASVELWTALVDEMETVAWPFSTVM
jgi:hypothetical protein